MSDRSRTPDLVIHGDMQAASEALARFVRPGCTERLFEFDSGNADSLAEEGFDSPSGRIHGTVRNTVPRIPDCPSGSVPGYPSDNCLCFFEYSSAAGIIYASLRYAILSLAFSQPFSTPKRLALRLFGASIHPSAYLSPQIFVDPLFPSLLTVEEGALVGLGARFALHEHAGSRFRAGRIIIRRGATIGADAKVACGVEIGEFAVVGVGAVVLRDVPARATVLGNPARIMRRSIPR